VRTLVLVALSALWAMAWEAFWEKSPIANGTSRIVVVQATSQERPDELYVDNRVFAFVPHPTKPNRYYAWLSIPYDCALESYAVGLLIEAVGQKRYAPLGTLEVVRGNYPKEELRVSSDKVHLTPEDIRRVEREFAQADKLYVTVTPQSHLDKPIVYPMQIAITSGYGNERVFNGLRKSYHSGVDFRAKTPQPISAIADGRVALIGDRFYGGKSVIIDHGMGVYSGYFHMSRIAVHEGEWVKQGSNLGKSGATGRITGPHLHMMFKIAGVSVDPIQAIEVFNRFVKEE